MGPEHYGWGGWWVFPFLMPLVMITGFVVVLYFIFGRGGSSRPWGNDSDSAVNSRETALDIVRKRYARGEISRDEFEQIKKDLES